MVHHPIFIRDRIKSFPFDPRTVLKNLLETGHSQISIENFDKESNKIIKQIYQVQRLKTQLDQGCVASIVKSKECLVFRHNYPAKAINCL
jgi:hypothetical protein